MEGHQYQTGLHKSILKNRDEVDHKVLTNGELTNGIKSHNNKSSKKEKSKSRNNCSFLKILGTNYCLLILLVLSIASIYNFWCTYNYWSLIRHRNMLQPDSRALRLFKNIPMENMRLCVSIFNYTNTEEHRENNSLSLKVENVGPFCFHDMPGKKSIKFNDDGTEISFQENSRMEFLPRESIGSLDDLVYVPNLPLFTIYHQVFQRNLFVQMTMVTKFKLNNYQPFLKLKVRDFLYGYDDPLIEWVYRLGHSPSRRFSMLESVVNSVNSNYTIDTGKTNIDNMGTLKMYNNKDKMKAWLSEEGVWKSEECNKFKGSYGAYWRPEMIRNGENITFFNGFLCRNAPLVKDKDTKMANFVSVVRYKSSPDLFTYASESDPPDSCYCLDQPCVSNLFNVGKCLEGPFVLSYRNFYGVDKKHLTHLNLEKIKTLTEDDEDWKVYFDIHPGLGNTMKFKTSFQMNVQVGKLPPTHLKQGLILPAVVIDRRGPNLNLKTTILLISLSIIEGILQYGSILLFLIIIYLLYRRIRTFYQPAGVLHKVQVIQMPIEYQLSHISEIKVKNHGK